MYKEGEQSHEHALSPFPEQTKLFKIAPISGVTTNFYPQTEARSNHDDQENKEEGRLF